MSHIKTTVSASGVVSYRREDDVIPHTHPENKVKEDEDGL